MKRSALICTILLAAASAASLAGKSEFSWQKPHAKVLPDGGLEWQPQPFEYRPGPTVRYIDFRDGSDDNPGTRAEPWKHHPWDPDATGKAKASSGPVTYVFKGGVIYRGALEGRESGSAREPIRLTRDPDWGDGPAWIVGSRAVTGGWKKADASVAPESMPDPEKTWYIDLPDVVEPWCIWQRQGAKAKRIDLARHPNWEIVNPDFVMEQWLAFDGPSRHVPKSEGGAPIGARKNWDEEFLKDPSASPDRFRGARIWTMWSGGPFSAMGTAYDGIIRSYDPETGMIERTPMGGAFYFGFGGKGDRYYMERLAEFLDSPGEFYFDPAGEGKKGGRLFVRLDGDADPNDTTLELGQEQMLLRLYDTHHVEITGLRFSFLNVPDDFNFPIYPLDMRLPTAVMLYGDCRNVTIANNDFYHAAKAVQGRTRITQRWMPEFMSSVGIEPRRGLDYMTEIVVSDNRISEADHGGVSFQGHGKLVVKGSPDHKLGDIRILRNKLHRINFRPRPPSPGLNIPAISVDDATRLEIAGNMLTRSWGVGIWVTGGKQNSGDIRDRPLIRNYIHHNKVIDSLLVVNDWGAFALWQGGPQYAWNNIAGNPVGPHPHSQGEADSEDRRARNHFRSYSHNGYAYYLDGSYKQYVFNNIAWGKENDPESWYKNRSAQMMVLGFLNHWFNNSFNTFLIGASGSSGTHSTALGNIYADMNGFIAQGISGDISTAYGGEDASDTLRIGMPTLGYARNIFHRGEHADNDSGFSLGTKGRGAVRIRTGSVDEFSQWLKQHGALAWQAGWMVPRSPFRDPAGRDFRPDPDVMAHKRGVKFFVPFSLYMTVGEWDFSVNRNDPEKIMGQNFYMSEEYISRKMYYDIPRNDLDVPGADVDWFTTGALEDWTESAMVFDGKSRYAVLPHERATADYPRSVAVLYSEKKEGEFWLGTPADPGPERKNMRPGQRRRWRSAKAAWDKAEMKTYPGANRRTVDMSDNNFLLEVYFQATGSDSASLAGKHDGKTGYELGLDAQGRARLSLMAGDRTDTIRSSRSLADGKWHHLIAEVDRRRNAARIYVDGKVDGHKSLSLPADASLSNQADFLIGKGSAGYFAGKVDFLRVCRGTLDDAETTIEELYAWQFDGPFLKDFLGRPRRQGQSVPGAIDLP